jgi:CDP-paratose 2-epimerase
VPTVANRFGVLAGPGQFGKCAQGWVAWWAIAAHFDLPLQYIGYKGKQVRDILFSDDVCRLFELQMKNIGRVAGQTFTAGGGPDNTLSLREASELVGRLFKRKIRPKLQPRPRTADFIIYISDNRKAQRLLGWKPLINPEKGYRLIADWVRREESHLRSLYL